MARSGLSPQRQSEERTLAEEEADGGAGQSSSAPALVLSRRSFARLSAHIREELGINLKPQKITMLQCRLQKRVRALGLPSLDHYCDLLLSAAPGDPERIAFVDAVTTNKTDFFREPSHFQYLMNTALPALVPAGGSPSHWRLRVWCAGCSTGEEPYTLAMVLSAFGDRHPNFDFSILATDISTRVLEAARLGIFDHARVEPVPAQMRPRFLLRGRGPREGTVRIVPALRSKVSFRRLNLMEADYGLQETFDVVFFRNVMIYFDRATQETIVKRMVKRIRRGGFLFIGHSESVTGLQLGLRPVSTSVFRTADGLSREAGG
jgi:chemotaxis protein methyltransferase CheR